MARGQLLVIDSKHTVCLTSVPCQGLYLCHGSLQAQAPSLVLALPAPPYSILVLTASYYSSTTSCLIAPSLPHLGPLAAPACSALPPKALRPNNHALLRTILPCHPFSSHTLSTSPGPQVTVVHPSRLADHVDYVPSPEDPGQRMVWRGAFFMYQDHLGDPERSPWCLRAVQVGACGAYPTRSNTNHSEQHP